METPALSLFSVHPEVFDAIMKVLLNPPEGESVDGDNPFGVRVNFDNEFEDADWVDCPW